MPEILPTPRAGHWLKLDLHDGSVPVPPRAGHVLKLSPVPIPAAQPRAGHWLKLDLVQAARLRRPPMGFLLTRRSREL